ncbi:MAG: flagellar export chaperone FliS [Nitrospina sp.]|jgi:flagellar secretion chaperone FliS|nr:flagellar export chaperone FliS [Nitrospina sp.]MBT3856262.1 flagellar export chaperone FliS [Nitrospina sp.]MBT4104295.1 flagellar export chaperone FliS [Nitrospina sp.]MBT4389724.1 flagellar export chaperone FliS [Nitrospina sp.]MBT4621850.1 flagellar export chaperone FliS [Nitrospina sp.]
MGPSRYHNQYRKNEISTSSQGRLILMMYEGAIKFTTMALQSIEKGDIAGQGKYINKTHDIINELSLALDLKKGGEVAGRLESLYQFILSQLTLANIKSDQQALKTVINILGPLSEAWEQLYNASTNTGQGDHQPPKNIASKC